MLLGLDLGTTNVKAVVTDAGGCVLARGSAPVETYRTPDGGTEQDVNQIWSATVSAIRSAANGHDIRAIGVSSQGGAMQVLDSANRPVGRVISWLDTRGGPFDRALTDELGTQWFARHTGHSGSCLTIGQLLRLRATGGLPENFGLGFVGDQIVRRLCGRAAHDATSLSLAMLYNPSTGSADAELLERLGLTDDRLPTLQPAREAAGTLTEVAAAELNLPVGIAVSPAIHDQYSAALCAGAVKPGDVMVGTGTAWVLLGVSDALGDATTGDGWVCSHLLPGRYGQILSLRTGGAAMDWACDKLNLGILTREQIDEYLSSAPAGAGGLVFDPPDRFSAEVRDLPAGCVLRAVVEGLCRELAALLDLLPGARRLVLTGAAAASAAVPQILADTTHLDVQCLTESDSSAFGAAILARAMLEPATLETIVTEMMPATKTVAPRST